MSPGETDITPQEVADIVRRAMGQPPYNGDKQLVLLYMAEIGEPVLVGTPEGMSSYWLVPMLIGDMACGFATVNLTGNVTRLGIFGGAPTDQAAWVKADFFRRPPAEILDEIAGRYPGWTISPPVFSYDMSPARWGWMVRLTRSEAAPVLIFITPGGWYEQYAAPPGNFER